MMILIRKEPMQPLACFNLTARSDSSTLSQNPQSQPTGFHQMQSRKWRLKLLFIMAIALILLIGINPALALKQGNQGQEVMELQQKLKTLGYFDHPVTGYYGDLTQAAVAKFQADNQLKVDGIAGSQTLAALGLSEAITTETSRVTSILKLGSTGSAVIELQQHLQVMGYFNEPITGFYGISTQTALIAFQAAIGLKPDGIAGPRTLSALELELNSSTPESSQFHPLLVPDRGDLR